jgi:glycosyltransferase involved in cell wall biosynthesis
LKLMVITQVLDRDDPVLGFAHEWMRALAERLERLIVVPLKEGRVDLPANVDVRSLGKERGHGTGLVLREFARVVGGACRRREVDAILAHMVPRYAVYAAPFALARGVKLFLWYTHKAVDWSLRAAEPLVAKAFTASDLSFRLPSRKKVVTGHGIDTDAFRPDASVGATHDVTVIGRIAPSKDPATLVEALGRLAGRGLRPKVLLAGGTLLEAHDEYEQRVRRRVAELGLAEQFTSLGAVPHSRIREVFLAAPIFVTPSLTGSIDKTVLEAMACERIPLTCNESFAEVFSDLAPRLMFPRGDAGALAERLAAVLALPATERAALGSRLRGVVVERHDLRKLAARLVTEMEQACSRSATRSPTP